MTKEEVKLQTKATALNAIRKIYNPHYKFPYSSFSGYGDWDDHESLAEQREKEIRRIIEQLEIDLKRIKHGITR